MASINSHNSRKPETSATPRNSYFSELSRRPVCKGKLKDRIGKLSDLVFALTEPYPEVVGIYIEHGWGKPSEFIPWDRVIRIEDDAFFVHPPAEGETYPPFVDQPGWILVDKHLVGRTILDMDGRRVEVVNDVRMVESKGKLLIVDVDISFNGFLRRIGLGRFKWIKEQLISWKYVQPLSVEDAVSTDKVTLSVTRRQLKELPSEDLADVLEELSGEEQEALFAGLDPEKAAETLAEAEPRAKRQLIADLREERARTIFSEMTTPHMAELFTILPHDNVEKLLKLVSKDRAERIKAILAEREATAMRIMSPGFVVLPRETKASEALKHLRDSQREPRDIAYLYVVGEEGVLTGVVDLRELILAPDSAALGEFMTSPVVTAEEDDTQEDLAEMFSKYHYRMIPVVDASEHLLGIVHYNAVMKGLEARSMD